MSKAVRSISAVLNIVFAVLAIGAVAWYFNDNGSFDPDEFHVFRYYTTDSNILAAVSAIIIAVCEFRGVRSKAAVLSSVICPVFVPCCVCWGWGW